MLILTKLLHLKEKNKSISNFLNLNNNSNSEILIGSSSKDLIQESQQNFEDFEISPDKLNSNVLKLIDDCIWRVFNIYRLYLINGVPLEVNIDQNLRDQLKKCIIKSKKQELLKNSNSNSNSKKLTMNNSNDDITKHKISKLKSTIKPLEDDTATSIISSSSNSSNSATATLIGVTGSGIGSQSSIPVTTTSITDNRSLNLSSIRSPSSNSGASKMTPPAPIDLQLCESYNNINGNNNNNNVLTPTETIIGPNLKILYEALEILKKISSHLYFLMENDSLPNFLKISSKKLQKLSNF
ncbi:unnamed protein product [[Candida] boidinii]|uniref:Unnamed protein product n=1 Tax=Candida boidinii TaxID=5477 RepID=A0ACB5U0V5_CANBO|nr:unnamed protein product [[Candida] boidinii]